MDELVQRLSEGEHPMAVERAEGKVEELKAMIDRDYVLVKFTKTRGGTELGYRLDKERSKLDDADWEKETGKITLVGNLNLNYVDVRCVANIELPGMEGSGHLEILEEGEKEEEDDSE